MQHQHRDAQREGKRGCALHVLEEEEDGSDDIACDNEQSQHGDDDDDGVDARGWRGRMGKKRTSATWQ